MASTLNASTTLGLISTADTSGVLQLQTANTAALTIDGSQNVGIGTSSPSSKLDVAGTSRVGNTTGNKTFYIGQSTPSGSDAASLEFQNSNAQTNWAIRSNFNVSGALEFCPSSAAGGTTYTTPSMLLNSSGNLGLGVTPSAWGSGYKTVQVNSVGAFFGTSSETLLGSNIYVDSGGNNKYITTSAASMYRQTGSGSHIWYIAGSGTAGNIISFTNAMSIDTNANLLVGTTSSDGVSRLSLTGSSATTNGVQIKFSGTASSLIRVVSGGSLTFGLDGADGTTERARIDSSGRFLVGTTSGYSGEKMTVDYNGSTQRGIVVRDSASQNSNPMAFIYGSTLVGYIGITSSSTSYNTSSDYRLKNTIAPMTGALAKVALLKPCTYKWNVDGSNGEGFIAHELAEVCPHAVTGEKDAVDVDGNPVYQGIDTSFLVATLTAAIQEQQAIIESLKADVAALKGTV